MISRLKTPDGVNDIVFIQSLNVDALIGVYDWEREQKQRLIIDLQIAKDLTQAGRTDNLAHTLDYAKVAEVLSHYIATTTFELLESLADACANLLIETFSVSWLQLKISKPGAIDAATCAGIIIERQPMIEVKG